ncbi:hypothetical protein Pyrde_1341 [Pyrodictium delaneyi]|uniref:Helicase HerA central domain-containing protein n=1 Tax=Pyrodictium delaneyi TaxID=1273541 RepID=A0A0P0N4N0_9CREN|nr:DUF87 domain-containing protein [Pyrodictium delaneyi]ALL01387.1 hypothetical protein Pyrde_1341 [Pyrodictium delaneyi]
MTTPPSSTPPPGSQGFVGFIASVESYSELRGVVYKSATTLLRYGALALVRDEQNKRHYLALVVDVSEQSLIPALDTKRLEEIARILEERGSSLADARRILEALFSPTSSLVAWHSLREIKLRLLGQLAQDEKGRPVLVLPEQPPRPSSIIEEPDTSTIEALLHRGIEGGRGIYLGKLAYNTGIRVYLDPDRLTMHLAVLGQTGSGKTETVKRIVAEYAWRKDEFSDSGGVIVFDIAGEYTGYPYRREDIVPLLDAVMQPELYTSLPATWARNTNKTILVPYDLSSVGFKRASDERYAASLVGLLGDLEKRFGRNLRGLVYGRHSIYLVDSSGGIKSVSRETAASLIKYEPMLVVATPLPSRLSVEEVYELSHTTSSAFVDALETVADILGLLDVGVVNEVKGLADIMDMLTRYKVEPRILLQHVIDAADEYRRVLVGRKSPAEAEKEACITLWRKLKSMGVPFVDCRSIAGIVAYNLASEAEERLSQPGVDESPLAGFLYKIASYLPAPSRGSSDPSISPWEVIATALEHDEKLASLKPQKLPEKASGELVGSLRASFSRVKSSLEGYAKGTVESLARGLRRVARHVSPHLDATHYRLIAQRLVEGFSIVHLAPPSRGDTDHAVARLIAEAFTVSTTSYSPQRRTLIVVEEAHNLAPAGENRASKSLLLRVAREGRKWGLSLILVSQRPGFIDPGILSQAATLIALRITNPDDLTGIKRGVGSVSQETVERLPDLEPGQALVSGLAVPERRIPLLVRVERLARSPKP